MDTRRGCRFAAFSTARANSRLFRGAVLAPKAGKQVKLLHLGAESQPGPAGMDITFPRGLMFMGL